MKNNNDNDCPICDGDGLDKTGTRISCYACNGSGKQTKDSLGPLN